jgi:two-component system NtrC family sensor kinase
LRDSQKNLISSIQSDQIPRLEFGDPETPIVLENRSSESGKKVTAYIQTFPLKVGSEPVGDVTIALAIAPQTHLVKVLRSKVLMALILLFVGTIIALCYFIFKLLHPLHAMATTCQQISEGNLHEIDIEPNASEVLILEMKFNEMVKSLKTKAVMERKLAQTQRLSSLGNLAAGVAHEIGNPLNGIKLTISHLKDIFSRDELDKPSFDRYADTVLSEVNRLDGIVRDFLMLAKERELSLRPHGLDVLLTETVRLIEKDARKKGVTIETNIAAGTKNAMIDPPLLKSALLNILINAIEASDQDKIVGVSYSETDGQVSVSIADQGTGIPEEIVDRIFEPYFSTKSTGTGLGLSLTRTIIEKHGGDLSLKSEVGRGTTVTVSVPVKDK